jgi:hypothetical protein
MGQIWIEFEFGAFPPCVGPGPLVQVLVRSAIGQWCNHEPDAKRTGLRAFPVGPYAGFFFAS